MHFLSKYVTLPPKNFLCLPNFCLPSQKFRSGYVPACAIEKLLQWSLKINFGGLSAILQSRDAPVLCNIQSKKSVLRGLLNVRYHRAKGKVIESSFVTGYQLPYSIRYFLVCNHATSKANTLRRIKEYSC